ncbi:YitT family protein [Paenibacillus sanguinis]|uniref:YitT family protein n=1 Tax=Paenibacillus sanguinis TaxID=225906 RepID=UPI0003744697|nr:YitT family protein [Paenibacillus sanguinis]
MKIYRIMISCLMVSTGVLLLNRASITTGGTVGLALSLTYLLHSPFSVTYFLVNLPFYVLSIVKLGWKFTLSTIAAVTLLSLLSSIHSLIPAFTLPMWFGAIAGGLVVGSGLALLLSSGSSLGGHNILALFLQQRYNWNPGLVMLVLDGLVLCLSFGSTGWIGGLYSVLSLIVLSFIINLFKSHFLTSTTPEPAVERTT